MVSSDASGIRDKVYACSVFAGTLRTRVVRVSAVTSGGGTSAGVGSAGRAGDVARLEPEVDAVGAGDGCAPFAADPDAIEGEGVRSCS